MTLFLNFMLYSSLILGLVYLLDRSGRIRSAFHMDLIWKGAVLASLLVLLPQMTGRGIEIALPEVAFDRAFLAPQTTQERVIPDSLLPAADDGTEAASAHTENTGQPAVRADGSAAPAPAAQINGKKPEVLSTQNRTQDTSAGLPGWESIALALYGLLAGFLVLRLFNTYRTGLQVIGRRRTVASDHRVHRLAAEVASATGMRKAPNLTVSDVLKSPVSLIRNEICLPHWVLDAKANEAEIRALLAHEVGHLRRGDAWLLMGLELLSCLLFFQPLYRLAVARLRVQAELCADSHAARLVQTPHDVARVLHTCARHIHDTPHVQAWGIAAASDKHLLKQRVMRLVMMQHGAPTVTGRAGYALIAVAVLAIGLLAPRLETVAAQQDTDEGGVTVTENRQDTKQESGNFRHMTPDYEFHAVWDGEFTLNAREDDLATLQRGGHLTLLERKDGVTREITWTNPDGEIRAVYNVSGERTSFSTPPDWQAAMILDFLRRSGWNAGERTARILDEGGVEAVLDEMEALPSDTGLGRYAVALISQADPVPGEMERLLGMLNNIVSDSAMGQVLAAFVRKGQMDRYAESILALAEQINSDAELGRILILMLGEGDFEPQTMPVFYEIAESIVSDAELGRVLVYLLDSGSFDAQTADAFLRVAAGINSDAEMGRVLMHFLENVDLDSETWPVFTVTAQMINSDAELGRLLRTAFLLQDIPADQNSRLLSLAADNIASDSELGRTLIAFLEGGEAAGGAMDALLYALDEIASDSEAARVFVHMAGTQELTEDQWVRVIDATEMIGSDSALARVLTHIAETAPNTPAVRQALQQASMQVGSRSQRARLQNILSGN